MKKEFNLSDRIISPNEYFPEECINAGDVKEFIKWCEKHSHVSEGVRVIDIEKLKEGVGDKLI